MPYTVLTQAEYGILILVDAPQECVNTHSPRRAYMLNMWIAETNMALYPHSSCCVNIVLLNVL